MSPNYKIKADNFESGVGTEYQLIIKDIDENKKKYILASSYGRSNDVVPLSFRNRDIIDISIPLKLSEYEKLKAKLEDVEQHVFSPIGIKNANIEQFSPASFPVQDSSNQVSQNIIVINDIQTNFHGGQQVQGLFLSANYYVRTSIKNISSKTLNDLAIEFEVPSQLARNIRYEAIDMTKDKDKTIFSFKVDRIYPGQIKSTPPFEIQVSNLTIDEYIDKNIIVRVFSEMPTVEKEVSVVDILHFNEYGTKKPLTRDDFASKYGP